MWQRAAGRGLETHALYNGLRYHSLRFGLRFRDTFQRHIKHSSSEIRKIIPLVMRLHTNKISNFPSANRATKG